MPYNDMKRTIWPGMQGKPAASPQEQLYQAIFNGREKNFLKLLKHPDISVNADGGLALMLAAEKKNFYFMRELVMAGADLLHARHNASEIYDGKYAVFTNMYKKDAARADAEKARDDAYAIYHTLCNYVDMFAKEVAPVEAARAAAKKNELLQKQLEIQQRTLQALGSLAQDFNELNNGPAFSKSPVKKNPPPSQGHMP